MTNPTAGTGGAGGAGGGDNLKDTVERVKKLQRAVYYLIWRRTGFGEQCIHCGHSYPGHEAKCKAAEIEELVR